MLHGHLNIKFCMFLIFPMPVHPFHITSVHSSNNICWTAQQLNFSKHSFYADLFVYDIHNKINTIISLYT